MARQTTLDYIDAMTSAPTIECLWDMHCRKMAEYGFDRLIYGYTRFRTATSLGDPDDFVILTNHDPNYTSVFIGERLFFHAPMVVWASQNDGVCSWGLIAEQVDKGTLDDEAMKVVEFNRKMGVTAGYTISFKSISPRHKGAIALTATRGSSQDAVDQIWKKYGAEIQVLNNVAHLKITSLPHSTGHRQLTPRQREALQWVGDGKTAQDTAELMGLTTTTVEKHLRLARDALGVDTTAQAVLKAALLNQMFLFDTTP